MNELSGSKTLNIGVPQGSILGPLLFLIYFEDLCSVSETGNEILFADDATIYDSGSNYYEIIVRMNLTLEKISKWLIANKLTANIIKTEGMIFSKVNITYPLPPLKLYGEPLIFSTTFKLLGLILDSKLTWKQQLSTIESRLSRACGVLYSIRRKITRSVARVIYMSIAYSHLMYGNTLWSAASQSHLEKIFIKQKKLIRLIMKKKRNTHTNPLFVKLKLLKLTDICKVNTLLFMFKTLNNLAYSPLQFQIRVIPGYQLRNNGNQLHVPFSRHSYGQSFIRIRGPNLWNNIPQAIRDSRTIMTFKRNIKKYYIESYSE